MSGHQKDDFCKSCEEERRRVSGPWNHVPPPSEPVGRDTTRWIRGLSGSEGGGTPELRGTPTGRTETDPGATKTDLEEEGQVLSTELRTGLLSRCYNKAKM